MTSRCLTGCIWTARAGSISGPVAEVLNDSYLSVLVKNRINSVGYERCATLGHRGPGPASPVSLLLPPPGVSCVSPLLRPQPPPLLLPQSLSREWVSRRAQVTFVPDAHRRGAPGDGPKARLRPPTSRVTVALASHTSSPPSRINHIRIPTVVRLHYLSPAPSPPWNGATRPACVCQVPIVCVQSI